MAKRYTTLYFFYFILCYLFYHIAASASLCYDLLDFLILYKQKGFSGFAINFNDAIVRPFFHINHLVILKLFGLNYRGWNFISVCLHSLNALLLAVFTKKFATLQKTKNAGLMAVFAGLIFLLSPCQTETVTWGCTIHYLTTTACVLIALTGCLEFLLTGKKGLIPVIMSCFIVGIFSLEYTLMLPFMLIALWLIFPRTIKQDTARQFWLLVVLPQLVFLPCYFLINKVVLGKFIGHYGAAAHLNHDPRIIFFNFGRMALNFSIFSEYLPGSINSQLLWWLTWYGGIIFGVLLVLTLWLLWVNRQRRLLVLAVVLYGLAIAPVVNLSLLLFFAKQSDRFGYLPMVFFSMALAYSAFTFINRKAAIAVLCLYLGLGCYFLRQNVSDWQYAGNISNKLVNDFMNRFRGNKVVLLGEAENYNGAYIFTPNFTGAHCNYDLDKRLWLAAGRQPDCELLHTVQFEMKSSTHGVLVQQLGPDSFEVKVNHPGIRLLHNYYPLKSYSDSVCSVQGDSLYQKCTVVLKDKGPKRKFIYQSGAEWMALN